MSRTTARLATVLIAAFLGAGCSGGSAGNSQDPAPNPPADTGAPGAPESNKAPVVRADAAAVVSDAVNIGVLANDSDPDGDTLTITSVGTPDHGVATVMTNDTQDTGDDFIRYVPDPGYVGEDRFTYRVVDAAGNSADGDVVVTVAPALGQLLAAADSAATSQDTPVVVPVLDNDATDRLTALSILSVSTPLHGAASLQADATEVRYTPDAGYSGVDSFTYTVTDGTDTAMAAVNVAIAAAGTTPPPAPPADAITGTVMVGPVAGALVRLFDADDAGFPATQTPLALTVTDVFGNWSVDLPADHGPLLVSVSGGAYPDPTDSAPNPADRRQVTLDDEIYLESLLPAGERYAAVTVVANALLIDARRVAAGSGFTDAFRAVRAEATTAYGFDPVSVRPDDPAAPDPASSVASRQYANAIGGAALALDQLVLSVGLARVDGSAIRALARDLSACGLDGYDDAGPVLVTVGGIDRAIPSQSFDLAVLRFRNNNIDRYGATPALDLSIAPCSTPGQAPVPPPAPEPPVTPPPAPDGTPFVVAAIADQDGTEETAFVLDISGNFADPDGDTLSFGADGLPSGLAIDPVTGIIAGEPTNADALIGSFTVTITADDGQLATSAAFVLSVANVNDGPLLVAPLADQAAVENLSLFINLRAAFDDPDNDPLTFTITGLPTASGLMLDAATGILSGAPSDADAAASPLTLSVLATDGVLAATDTFVLDVSDINNAPAGTAINSTTILEGQPIGTEVGLFATTDADAADVHAYRLVGGAGASGNGAFAIIGARLTSAVVFDVALQSSYSVRVRTDDSNGGVRDDVFAITVLPAGTNQSPTTTGLADIDVTVNDTDRLLDLGVAFDDAEDTDADLVYSVVANSNPGLVTATVEPPGTTLRLALTADATGTATITVRATDTGGLFVETSFVLSVNSPPPEADLDLSITVDEPVRETSDPVVLAVTVSNSGPDAATGIVVGIPEPLGLVFDTVSPDTGTYDAIGGFWQGFGLSDGATATITITATVTLAPGNTLTTGAEIVGSGQADPDTADLETVDITVVGSGTGITWLGGDAGGPTDWSAGANWSTGAVPGPLDKVRIPPTANDPVLDADRSVTSIDVEAGATLDLAGNELTVFGEASAAGSITGPCPSSRIVIQSGTLDGNFPSVDIAGPVSADDSVAIACDLVISAGRFHQAGRTVDVAGNFAVLGSGILLQHHGNDDELFVQGDVLFAGGDHSQPVDGQAPLIDGYLYVGGDFAQVGHPHAFAAEKAHQVVLDGSGDQVVALAHPDVSNPDPDTPPDFGSRFGKLRIEKTASDGIVDFVTDIAVVTRLIVTRAYDPVLTSSTSATLTAAGVRIQDVDTGQSESVTFDGLPLTVVDGNKLRRLDGARFTNMDPTVPQLTLIRSDANDLENGGFSNLIFDTVPDTVSGGYYIDASNPSPDPVIIRMINPSPVNGQSYVRTTGPISIDWTP